MQKFSLTSVGAVVTAVLASLCCIGPVVLAGLGIAGLGSAGLAVTIFEPYRPYLIGLTALFLGVGFFVTYRKQEAACQEGEACALPRSRKMQKAGLWAITGITGLMLAVPYLPLSGTSSVPSANATEMATFTIEGMDCAGCASGIAASLTRQDGIGETTVDFEKGTATVMYTPGIITPEQIAERIAEQGFVATLAGKPVSQAGAKPTRS